MLSFKLTEHANLLNNFSWAQGYDLGKHLSMHIYLIKHVW